MEAAGRPDPALEQLVGDAEAYPDRVEAMQARSPAALAALADGYEKRFAPEASFASSRGVLTSWYAAIIIVFAPLGAWLYQRTA